MKKESLKIENITKDMSQIAYKNLSNVENWRLTYIFPLTTLAVALGLLFKSIIVGLLIFSLSIYHIVIYAKAFKDYKDRKKILKSALDRGDISISVEILSHISEETIYEPHTHRRGSRIDRDITKYISVLYFMSGGSWRIPNVYKHYAWSPDYYLSTEGLKNISVQGNEYYYICLQGYHDIAYVYPLKFFELDESLKSKALDKNNDQK